MVTQNPLDVTDGAGGGGGRQNKAQVFFVLFRANVSLRAVARERCWTPASWQYGVWATKARVLKAPDYSLLVTANSQAELWKHEQLLSWQRQACDAAAGRGQVDTHGHNKTLSTVLSGAVLATEPKQRQINNREKPRGPCCSPMLPGTGILRHPLHPRARPPATLGSH